MQNQPITRRRFLQGVGKGLLATLFTGTSAWHYVTQVEPGWIDVNEVALPLRRLSPSFHGLRLAQISDIHLGSWMKRSDLDRIVRLVLDAKPDLVALTGDYLIGHGWQDRHAALLDDLAAGLRPLSEACPVVAVLGNHDHWSRPSAVRSMLARAGAIDLSNTVHTLRKGSDQLHLCGVDDIYVGADRLDEVLAQLPEEGAAILLAHEPDFADTSAAAGRFDLQISGHSHGGQVSIPFIGPPVLPKHAKKYPSGLYQVGEMYQYTNRGVGVTGINLRFNCRPEITVFVMR